jgi:hypothetical protein
MRALASTAALIAASLVPAQTPAVDASLPERIKELRALVKHPRMEDDYRAIDRIRELAKDPAARHPKDQERIADALGDVFRAGKTRPPGQSQLYEAAADALASFGADGARALQKAATDDRVSGREYARLRAHLVRALGRTKDESQVDWLLEQALRSPDDPVLAAAGEALGNFTALPVPKLRDVVKRMVGRFGEWDMRASQLDPTDPNAPIDLGPQNARATLDHVRGPWNATLRALTGQSLSDAPDWQRWLNKNKEWLPPGRKP